MARMGFGVGAMTVALVAMVAGTAYSQDSAEPAAASVTTVDTPASTNTWFMRVGYSPTRALAPGALASGEDAARTLTVDIGRQTDGTRDWHRVYNYPSYGVGLFIGRFDQDRELGRPFATYGFF